MLWRWLGLGIAILLAIGRFTRRLSPGSTPEQLRGISDLVHAMHAATGAEVPCNEEWYYRPPSSSIPMRMRILIKWRISTIAGFEGGTRIYLNTIDPWSIKISGCWNAYSCDADECSIAPMKLGEECKVTLLR